MLVEMILLWWMGIGALQFLRLAAETTRDDSLVFHEWLVGVFMLFLLTPALPFIAAFEYANPQFVVLSGNPGEEDIEEDTGDGEE